MTNDEAKKVIRIMFLADFGCPICVEKLCKQFINEFPEFEDIVKTEFKNEFSIELENINE